MFLYEGPEVLSLESNAAPYLDESDATPLLQTPHSGSRFWLSITSSSDGTKLAAVENNGNAIPRQTEASRGLRNQEPALEIGLK
jgi:hypothetical protein